MAVAFFALYLLLAAVHLYGWAANKKLFCTVTKPVLMPALFAFYLCGNWGISPYVAAAILLAALGDILLMREGKPVWFFCGGIAFLFCHVMYIISFAPVIQFFELPAYAYLPALLYIAAGAWIFTRVRVELGAMAIPFILYIAAVGLMSVAAFLRLLSLGSFPALAVFIGSVFFFLSDSLLTLHLFRAKVPRGDLAIMATYCAAQLLIVGGVALA